MVDLIEKLCSLEDLERDFHIRKEMLVSLAKVGPQVPVTMAFWKAWDQHSLAMQMKFRDWIKELEQVTKEYLAKI